MPKTILILGGTGMLGAPVARRLQADGFEVRLLARDPAKAHSALGGNFNIIQGDVADKAQLEQAMTGCDGVHVSVGGAVDQLSAEYSAALAPRVGVRHVTYVSGSTVKDQNGWFPMTRQKLNAEKAIRESGIHYTIFCPTWPMEQLPRFVRAGRATLIGELPTPYHWFAADDFAAMVSKAYQIEAALDKRLYVHGPEAIMTKTALERYCSTFHPDIKSVSAMPILLAKAIGTVTGSAMLKFAADLMAYFKQVGEPGDPTEANLLLGAPTTTLDMWMAHRLATSP